MSLALVRSFLKIYPYVWKTPLSILRKCVVEIYANCTGKRTFATFHVINAAASCILGKYRSELLCVSSVRLGSSSKRRRKRLDEHLSMNWSRISIFLSASSHVEASLQSLVKKSIDGSFVTWMAWWNTYLLRQPGMNNFLPWLIPTSNIDSTVY